MISMLVMAVLLLAGTTFLTISSTEYQIAINEQASARSFELADMGMQRAMAQLSANPAYTQESNVPLSVGLPGNRTTLGTVTIMVSASTRVAAIDYSGQQCPIRDVTVTAAVPVQGGSSTTQLRATVDGVTQPFRWGLYGQTVSIEGVGGPSLLDSYDSGVGGYSSGTNGGGQFDLAASLGITLLDTIYSGNIYSQNASTSPSVGTWVGGSQATPPPPMAPDPGPFAADYVVPDNYVPAETDPPLAPGSYNSITVGNSSVIKLATGTYNLNISATNCSYPAFQGGPVGFNISNFSLCLGNGAKVLSTGPVTIFARGNVSAADNSKIGGQSQFSGSGDVLTGIPAQTMNIMMTPMIPGWAGISYFSASNFSFFGTLYAPNTDVILSGNSLVLGSMIGRTVSNLFGPQSQLTYHFDRALKNQNFCTPRFTLRPGTWEEVVP